MAIQTSDAIVLKKQNLRETSLILTFLTKDFGKISGVIKGARGPKAIMGNNPQVFSLNNIVFYERKRGNLNAISQCDLKDFFEPIRNDFERTVYADYFLELVDAVTTEGEANEDIYNLLLDSLTLLSKPVSPKRVARIFEIKLMDISGFMPEFKKCLFCKKTDQQSMSFSLKIGGLVCNDCEANIGDTIKLSKGTINFIEKVRKGSFVLIARIKVSSDVGRELEKFLRMFVDYHIQRELKTVKFLKKVRL